MLASESIHRTSTPASSLQIQYANEMTQQTEHIGLSDNYLDSAQYCLICNDKATGKHYGASSCDGCKGFFRRSVRKQSNYTCQYNQNCKMDKDKRNQCRYCRLKKCILVGMKRAAVQNERDRISARRSSLEDITPNVLLSIQQLMQAEQRIAVQKILHSPEFMHRLADVPNVCESMRSQLFLLVNWAKGLPCFSQLSLDDQIALIKAHAREILILGVIKRSFQLEADDVLLLGNDLIISRHSGDKNFAAIASHILDDLFIPLRELQLDEAEFICLKAIVFFDPKAVAVTNCGKELIRRCRNQIQAELMNHMNDKQYHKCGRFGELLLAIPDLRYVAQMMVKKVEFLKMTGLAELDSLLSETLLVDILGDSNNDTTFAARVSNHNKVYNPTNLSLTHASSSYDSVHLLQPEQQLFPHDNCQGPYTIPSFMPNQILLDIDNQDTSHDTANHVWRQYLPTSNSMTPGHIYSVFATQEAIHNGEQGSHSLNSMMMDSEGMMLKSDLFSVCKDDLALYQHSGAVGHDETNFLKNLDQNFPLLNQQHQTKYRNHNGDNTQICDGIQTNQDSHVIDSSSIAPYPKSQPSSPMNHCHMTSHSGSQHDPMATIFFVRNTARVITDQHQRISLHSSK